MLFNIFGLVVLIKWVRVDLVFVILIGVFCWMDVEVLLCVYSGVVSGFYQYQDYIVVQSLLDKCDEDMLLCYV